MKWGKFEVWIKNQMSRKSQTKLSPEAKPKLSGPIQFGEGRLREVSKLQKKSSKQVKVGS